MTVWEKTAASGAPIPEVALETRETGPAKPTKGVSRFFFDLLHCPYCGFVFDLEPAGAETETIEYGILRCGCYEYPIVEAIPILQQIDGLERVVLLIRKGQQTQALLRAFDLFRVQWALRSKLHRLRYYWNCSQLTSKTNTTFQEAALLVRRPRVLADYLIHRYANPSFLASIGPLLLLEDAAAAPVPGPVLDLACGAGHATFLMRLLYPSLPVISADCDFVNVYLTRRYMAPDGLQLCVDAQIPSPFPDAYFKAVYCQDAFHYLRSKKFTVQELKRILRPDALWVFPHLHNRLCDNVVAGLPLSPEGYQECFDLTDGRLFAESDLLQELAHTGVVDFCTSIPASRLSQAANLTFIRAGANAWRSYRCFPEVFCRRADHLRINPIYRSRRLQDGLSLQLNWPNPLLQKECAEAETVLPHTSRLTTAQLARLGRESTNSKMNGLEDLVAKFVVVPLPRSYTAETLL